MSLPDGLRVRKALAGCELVIVSDVSAHTDTTALAHILPPAAIFREHAALSGFKNRGRRAFDISSLASLTDDEWDKLTPVKWPVNAQHPDGKARLIPVQPRLPVDAVVPDKPLLLNTGRTRDQCHTMTLMGLVSRLMQHQ